MDNSRLAQALSRVADAFEPKSSVRLARYVEESDTNPGYHVVDVLNPDNTLGERMEVVGSTRAWAGKIVRIGFDRKRFGEGEWAILATDTNSYTVQGVAPPTDVTLHGEDHGYNQSDETSNLHPWQLYPLRVQPTDPVSLSIEVALGVYRAATGWDVIATITTDLTANVPGSNRRYVLISIDNTGSVTATNGSAVASPGISDIPEPPDGDRPLGAVLLVAGDTSIPRDRIVDLRWAVDASALIGLEDNAGTAVYPDSDHRIQVTDDDKVNADASGNTLALSIDESQLDIVTISATEPVTTFANMIWIQEVS